MQVWRGYTGLLESHNLMHLILKIGISRNTECVNTVGFPKLGHIFVLIRVPEGMAIWAFFLPSLRHSYLGFVQC